MLSTSQRLDYLSANITVVRDADLLNLMRTEIDQTVNAFGRLISDVAASVAGCDASAAEGEVNKIHVEQAVAAVRQLPPDTVAAALYGMRRGMSQFPAAAQAAMHADALGALAAKLDDLRQALGPVLASATLEDGRAGVRAGVESFLSGAGGATAPLPRRLPDAGELGS